MWSSVNIVAGRSIVVVVGRVATGQYQGTGEKLQLKSSRPALLLYDCSLESRVRACMLVGG